MTRQSALDDRFVHPALFYRDDAEYLAGTVPFVRAGLAAGEPVAVAVPPDNLRLLRDSLGVDAASVRLLDMTVAGRNPGRIIPGVLRAFADAHRDVPVRIIGEPIWAGRNDAEYPACAQHEALINLAFAGRAVTILCPYHTGSLSPQVLADAAVTHPVLVDDDGERHSDHYDPYAIINGYNTPLPAPPHAASIRFTFITAARARRFAVETARRLRLPDARIADLELAAAELAANAVTHGGGTATITMWADHRYVICQVQDGGHLTDPLAGRVPVTPDSLRGRGLLLINHVVDLVRIHTSTQSTTTRVHIAHDYAKKPPCHGELGTLLSDSLTANT
ncbi:anti-sigma factor RsbA family regulatory protein [Actinoplanes sp. NPDC051346]|uniref:anti-sigma factor RsbA family regulatory protein n=1 Tax=Actinoplanes sp. NPDC051346 TaxID=3155048 RepID=UPI003441714F